MLAILSWPQCVKEDMAWKLVTYWWSSVQIQKTCSLQNKCRTADPDRQNLRRSGKLSFFVIYKFCQNCTAVRQVSNLILKTGHVCYNSFFLYNIQAELNWCSSCYYDQWMWSIIPQDDDELTMNECHDALLMNGHPQSDELTQNEHLLCHRELQHLCFLYGRYLVEEIVTLYWPSVR